MIELIHAMNSCPTLRKLKITSPEVPGFGVVQSVTPLDGWIAEVKVLDSLGA